MPTQTLSPVVSFDTGALTSPSSAGNIYKFDVSKIDGKLPLSLLVAVANLSTFVITRSLTVGGSHTDWITDFSVGTGDLPFNTINNTGVTPPIMSPGTYALTVDVSGLGEIGFKSSSGGTATVDISTGLARSRSVASLAASVLSDLPVQITIPSSGTLTSKITFLLFDTNGALTDENSGVVAPNVALKNDAGTDLSSRLTNWTRVSTGNYTLTYTSTSTDTEESLHLNFSIGIGTSAVVGYFVGSTKVSVSTSATLKRIDRGVFLGVCKQMGAIADTASVSDIGTLLG